MIKIKHKGKRWQRRGIAKEGIKQRHKAKEGIKQRKA